MAVWEALQTLENPSVWVMLIEMDAAEMGRRGGQSRSAAKRAAARRNGARGGRPREAEVLARKIREVCARLAPVLPGIDPGDLRLIVRCMLLPPARRAVFVSRRSDGRYVF
jgi:hypothetical protein